jgi:hypothetical protein
MSYSVTPPTRKDRLLQNFINRCLEVTKRDRVIKAFLKPNEKNSKRSDDKN